MMCLSAKRRIADYVDGRLRQSERSRVAAHLQTCASCFLEFDQMHSVRSALRDLPARTSPPGFTTRLLVKASQERQALLDRRESRVKRLLNRWRMRVNELMRPLTIPATGGLLSSIILFGGFAFTVASTSRSVNYEVPILFASHLDANLLPLQLRNSVILTLSLDSKGRITDYAFRNASTSFVGDASRLQYNNISLPKFPEVLSFAQPISGDISIQFTPIVFRQ